MKALLQRAGKWLRSPRVMGYQAQYYFDPTTWGFALGFGNCYAVRVLVVCCYVQVYKARS